MKITQPIFGILVALTKKRTYQNVKKSTLYKYRHLKTVKSNFWCKEQLLNICVSFLSWKLRSIWWRICSKVFRVKKSAARIKPIIFYIHDRYKLSLIMKLYNQFFDVKNSSWTSACLLWVENWDPFGDESVPRCFVSKKSAAGFEPMISC